MKISKLHHIVFALLIATSTLLGLQCSKEQELNPFANSGTKTIKPNSDLSSIQSIHNDILISKCNNPGCHDGTFEPDFRSVQSSYSTLVYKGLNKNTLDSQSFFKYRVVPFDTSNSFLHERLCTRTSDYMPSNGQRLSRAEINRINQWIMKGAPNIDGNILSEPDNLPVIQYYLALDDKNIRIDSIRLNKTGSSPFIVKANQKLKFWFVIKDDNASIEKLSVNQLKISGTKDDFSNAFIYQASLINYNGYKVYEAVVNTSANINTQYWFRYYVSDDKHSGSFTEFPDNSSPQYFKDYYSFIIK